MVYSSWRHEDVGSDREEPISDERKTGNVIQCSQRIREYVFAYHFICTKGNIDRFEKIKKSKSIRCRFRPGTDHGNVYSWIASLINFVSSKLIKPGMGHLNT